MKGSRLSSGVVDTVVTVPSGLELPEGAQELVLRRSERRRKSVTARWDGPRIIIMVPAGMSAAEEDEWVRRMVHRLADRSRAGVHSDDELMARAAELRRRCVPEAPEPVSVRWVTNQHARWGSCTPADRTIRLSDRLRAMPDWVIDAVLVHELVHLVHPHHDGVFRSVEHRYELADKAAGFLEGWVAGFNSAGGGGPATA